MFKNQLTHYGLISILIHWLTVIIVSGLAILGLWMVDLDYYSEWYKTGPEIHRSVGVLFAMLLLFRMVWRFWSPPPGSLESHQPWERKSARIVHWILLLLMWAVIVAGYLISTADDRGIDVFGWFVVPATLTSIPDQEDLAGDIHFYLAMTLLALAFLHGLAALKHHFIDHDGTLVRMFGR